MRLNTTTVATTLATTSAPSQQDETTANDGRFTANQFTVSSSIDATNATTTAPIAVAAVAALVVVVVVVAVVGDTLKSCCLRRPSWGSTEPTLKASIRVGVCQCVCVCVCVCV